MSLANEIGMIRALWFRDLVHFVRAPTRLLGVVVQPTLMWLILGTGLRSSVSIAGSRNYQTYFFPGILAMIILFTAIFATISLIEDRQVGFLKAVLVAPGSRLSLVLGKISGVTTVVFVQVGLFLLLAPFAGYSLAKIAWGQFTLAVLLTTLLITSIGVIMAWKFDSVQSYHAIMSVVLVPMWIVSGAMFPVSGNWVDWIIRINPMSYAVAALRLSLDTDYISKLWLGESMIFLLLTLCSILALALATQACQRSPNRM